MSLIELIFIYLIGTKICEIDAVKINQKSYSLIKKSLKISFNLGLLNSGNLINLIL